MKVKSVWRMPLHFVAWMCFHSVAGAGTAPSKSSVAITPSKAREFLTKLSRTKRNIWDRSRPDVQQWIMQFMYMGFDEQVGCVRSRRVQVSGSFSPSSHTFLERGTHLDTSAHQSEISNTRI